jgi:hypothetical protein
MSEEKYAKSQLESAKTLYLIAIYTGPISIFFGGTLLSILAFACACVAFSKCKKLIQISNLSSEISQAANLLLAKSKVALIVSIVALAVNIVSLAIALPLVINFIQNPNEEAIYNLLNASLGSGEGVTGSGNSTWG